MLAGACITRTRGGLARNGDFADPYLCAGYPRTADGITSQWSFGGGTGTSYFRLRLLNDGDRKTDGARSDSCRRRSEEHTSELQSQSNLVCRLLLEKKKKDKQLVSQ